jgi:hypothetical protein
MGEFDIPANHKESHEYHTTNQAFAVIYITVFIMKLTPIGVSPVRYDYHLHIKSKAISVNRPCRPGVVFPTNIMYI